MMSNKHVVSNGLHLFLGLVLPHVTVALARSLL